MKRIVLISGVMSDACGITKALTSKGIEVDSFVVSRTYSHEQLSYEKLREDAINMASMASKPNGDLWDLVFYEQIMQRLDIGEIEKFLDQKREDQNNVFLFDLNLEKNIMATSVLDNLIPRYIKNRSMPIEQFYFYSTRDAYEQEARFIWPQSFIKSVRCPEILLFNTNERFIEDFGKIKVPLEKTLNYEIKDL